MACILLFSLAGHPLSRAATSETPGDIAARVEAHYRGVNSLSFSFAQKTSGQLSGRPKSGKGNGVFAKRDGRTYMRWNYVQPERQVVISDGDTISMYFEKLNQMIISDMDPAQADVLFSFFTGNSPLSENFEILAPVQLRDPDVDKSDSGLQAIALRPLQPQNQLQTIYLWVTADSLIRRIVLLDHFDTRTEINLSNIIIDPLEETERPDLEAIFAFTPPDGTEIIRQ